MHGSGSGGWQYKVFLSVAAILFIPYSIRIAYELMLPFIWLFYFLIFAAIAGVGFALYRRWCDGY